MVADDTGSAIKGPARGDIFVGSGQTAGAIAGEIRHKADFTILVPNIRLGPRWCGGGLRHGKTG